MKASEEIKAARTISPEGLQFLEEIVDRYVMLNCRAIAKEEIACLIRTERIIAATQEIENMMNR